jgi:AcrR family transcriptional regulator
VVTIRRRTPGQRRTREQNAEAKYQALLHAAAEVVGEQGYLDATISRITTKANVAQGTFYSYFENRQDLFDQLLPKMGGQMLDFITMRTRGVQDTTERERKGFLAFFDFIVQNPSFLRVLNEAEQIAPKGHRGHFSLIVHNYLAGLERDWERGEYPGYQRRELEVVVYILIAARSYLALRYAIENGEIKPIPSWVTDAYMKFITYGLRGAPAAERSQPAAKSRQRTDVSVT